MAEALPSVRLPETEAVPVTSKVALGVLVPIPILLLVVSKFIKLPPIAQALVEADGSDQLLPLAIVTPPAVSKTKLPLLKVLKVKSEELKVSPDWRYNGAFERTKEAVGFVKFRS